MRYFASGWRRWLVLALVAGGVAAFFFWPRDRNGANPTRYRTAAVDRGSIVQRVNANGTLNPVTVVNVGTQISGTVLSLHTDFNQRVKAGQILAELDPVLLKAQIAQSEANIANARAALALAEATLKRNRDLVAKGFVSPSVIDQSVKDLDSAKAQIAVYEAQLKRDRANLEYSVIRAPISGVVINRAVDLGQTVAASFQTPTLFQIAQDLAQMQIDTSVAEADIGGLREGQPVRFNVDSYAEREFTATVKQIRINPTIQQNVVTYDVVIAVKNDEGLLLPGMTAHVNIVVNRKDEVLRLPAAALRFRPAEESAALTATREAGSRGNRVYRLGADGKPQAVEVKTGITDNRYVELTEGNLKPGDALVVREVARNAATDSANFRFRLF
jgi:HlyD family secretion protein